jgi:hypothetical protein
MLSAMRAPRAVRDFCAWRWAPSVALAFGALVFVAVAVLLIPADFASKPPSALVPPSVALARRTPIAVGPATRAPSPAAVFVSPPTPAVPSPTPAEPDPVGLEALDFAAHREDRGDRPRTGTPLAAADSGH